MNDEAQTGSTGESTPDPTPAPAPAKPKRTRVKATKTRASRSTKKVTLAQAQQSAQAEMQTHSASMTQIVDFLTRKKNRGEVFSPTQIAAGIGHGVTDRDIRKTLQKNGLASSEGKAGVIQSGPWFLYLSKSGNRNGYRALPEGTPPPTNG